MKTIEVFRCPYSDDCFNKKEYYYADNEAVIVKAVSCKAPFLYHRKNKETICRITIEADKVNNWKEAIKDIGRRKAR